jgi:hypothetical protein
MRAPFQEGDFPFPVKYGYATVGIVERGPDALIGRTVFTLHPHQSLFAVPAEAPIPLPDSLPPKRAILAANMETALNALWDSAARTGERVTVIGAGLVGCLTAYLASRLAGAQVTLIDIRPDRSGIAAALGLDFSLPQDARPGAEVVFHTSASEAGLRLALDIAAFEARIIEMSWFGDKDVNLPLVPQTPPPCASQEARPPPRARTRAAAPPRQGRAANRACHRRAPSPAEGRRSPC